MFKAELRAAEVDPHFEFVALQIRCNEKLIRLYFLSDRFEMNRTWTLILGLVPAVNLAFSVTRPIFL